LQFNKRDSLTKDEFNSAERVAGDLKRRLSGVQNALRDIIKKLKAAGQWEDLDLRIATISHPKFQAIARENSFKTTLEEAASGLTNDASEISTPLQKLKLKVITQNQDLEPQSQQLAWRLIPVAYNPATPMMAIGFRCRIAYLRFGVSGALNRQSAQEKAGDDIQCYCEQDPNFCSFNQ